MKRITIIFIYVLVILGLLFSSVIAIDTPVSLLSNTAETIDIDRIIMAYGFLTYVILTPENWTTLDKSVTILRKPGLIILTVVLTVFILNLLGMIVKVLS